MDIIVLSASGDSLTENQVGWQENSLLFNFYLKINKIQRGRMSILVISLRPQRKINSKLSHGRLHFQNHQDCQCSLAKPQRWFLQHELFMYRTPGVRQSGVCQKKSLTTIMANCLVAITRQTCSVSLPADVYLQLRTMCFLLPCCSLHLWKRLRPCLSRLRSCLPVEVQFTDHIYVVQFCSSSLSLSFYNQLVGRNARTRYG